MNLRTMLLAPALAVVVLLAGCAPGYGQETAESLQTRVAAVTEASSVADWTRALAELDVLTADAAAALQAGLLPETRHDSIIAAIALVRAELDAALAASVPADDAPVDDSGPEEDTGNGNGNNGNGNGNNGNGNGNGNGSDGNNGNSNNGDDD
jgi:ABC-type phosphate/phosphonate transport system substrate-binding protein